MIKLESVVSACSSVLIRIIIIMNEENGREPLLTRAQQLSFKYTLCSPLVSFSDLRELYINRIPSAGAYMLTANGPLDL